MKNTLLAIIFSVGCLLSSVGYCSSEPSDSGQLAAARVGYFLCTDCEMTLGPVGPDTYVWIETVVNNYDGGTWLTSDGSAKFFVNCNATTCVRINYVKAGTFAVVSVVPNPGNLKYTAIGSAEGGATPEPGAGSGSGGGSLGGSSSGSGGSLGSSSGYWLTLSTECYEYFSDGVSEGVQCYEIQ